MWRVVIGVIGNDTHVVGLRLLELGLQEREYSCFNIGASCKVDEFVDAAIETNAHAVLVSSLNGEAEYWCQDIRLSFEEVNRGNVLLYLGGNPVIGEKKSEWVIDKFRGFGFDRVFYREKNLSSVFTNLKRDLELRYSTLGDLVGE